VTATLKLKIINKTGSERTAFGYTATLVEENPACGTTTSEPLLVSCIDERCSNAGVAPGQTVELGFGEITFKCGSSLKLTNVLQFWTDASPKSTCDSFATCKNLSPKCDRPGGELIIRPPLSVSAEATCIEGTTLVDIHSAVVGGKAPYSFLWSPNGETTDTLVSVPDGEYEVTVTESGKGCTAKASVNKKGCCYFDASCRQLSAINLHGCNAGDLPQSITEKGTIFDVIASCGEVTMTLPLDVITGDICPVGISVDRNYTLSDEAGHSLSCTQKSTVTIKSLPVISHLENKQVECSADCSADNKEGCFDTPTAEDACGKALVPTVDGGIVTAFGCGQTGTFSQTWRVTDDCGNSATPVTQTVTIVDHTPPEIEGGLPGDLYVNCLDAIAAAPTLTATDICGSATVTASCGCSVPGVIQRVWTATDDCTNEATHTQQITFSCAEG